MNNFVKFNETLSELMSDEKMDNKGLAKAINVNVTAVCRWRREATKIYLSNIISICDYFHCSLEYLFDRTDTKLDYIPHMRPPFYERIRAIMIEKGITRYQMTTESKFKESYFHRWKNGSEPQIPTLIELADYFGITLDYLVGRDR